MGIGVVTLPRKGVKKWLSQTERGDAVAAGMKAAGNSGGVFGGRAEETETTYRDRCKVKRYWALGRLRNRRSLLFNGIGFDGGHE